MARLRVAAAQYPPERVASPDAWRARAERWVAEAAGNGAELLVFPEYGAMELTATAGADGDLAAQTAALQPLVPLVFGTFADLARRHGVWVLAPGVPVRRPDGRLRNVSRLIAPDGRAGEQEKLVPTRFEREHWDLGGGDAVRVFGTPWGRLGVCICYDAEFPLIARAQAEAGAVLLLVPSCTDTAAGWHRVRVGAAARALENQCFVVQSPTVGAAPWCPAIDVNVGAAAVYAPPDVGMPDDGVVAIGTMNEPGWLYADLDLAAVERVRREGQVLNLRHWPDHARPGPAEVRELTAPI
ncbi:carbon-nitrogen hydrolase family protein [Azospirillum halopraeferens]|uniref:carbon-nitrogen hydrolase family protein n=1 Tax=Azospirillum halopraeferens TaxID=34010 RepID=UPI00048EDBC2|nr:carbon-nitrogen hydrolase family protein [Azospirillum halopraeferens]